MTDRSDEPDKPDIVAFKKIYNLLDALDVDDQRRVVAAVFALLGDYATAEAIKNVQG